MSVQLLLPEYINKVKPAQVEAWVEQGLVIKQGNKYFVAGNNIERFSESCFVKSGDNIQTFQLDAKGTIVEKTTPKSTGEIVGTPTRSYTVSIDDLVARMGITDENLKTQFKNQLQSTQGLTIQDNTISFTDVNILNTMLSNFAQTNQANFVNQNTNKYITFAEDSDQTVISNLQAGESPAIGAENNGKHQILNSNTLNQTLTEQIGEITYENTTPRSASIDASLTIKTTTREGQVNVPENLRENKQARKQLEADSREAYANMVANADPQTRDAIDLYIAERKYANQIDKKMAELLEYEYTIGDKTKKATRDGADIIQLYVNQYMSSDDKTKFEATINNLVNSQNTEDQNAILETLKSANIIGANLTSFTDLSPKLKRKGALLCAAKACGYEATDLQRLMATYEVMNSRKQVLKDDQWFINTQAKDYVKNQQTAQDLTNTTIHFSSNARKNAPEDGRIHTDIGDKGRMLVQTCPEMLCDEINANNFDANKDGCFQVTINGETRYFEFNPEKWNAFMGLCCDPTTDLDARMQILFGNNTEKRDAFLKDLNLTLQEGRSILDMNLPSPYGETGTLKFANIIGNNNGKIDNKELNALRHMVESAGYSVDSNPTYLKRFLHVLKDTGIGAGIGFLTGGMGSLLAGAVNISGQTAAQLINTPVTLTGDATLGYDTSVTNTNTIITIRNGETFTNSTTNVTPVSGTTTGEVTLQGNVSVEAPGQPYSGSGNKHLPTGINAGIIGATGGLIHSLLNRNKIHAEGRNADDIFDLTRLVDNEETTDETLSIQIPQFTTVETRRGSVTESEKVEEFKAVKWRSAEAYSVMYVTADGKPVNNLAFKKAYEKQTSVSNMTNKFFYAFPELTLEDGTKIVLASDYKARYNAIQQGVQGTATGGNYDGNRTVIRTVQGTIK